MKNFLSSVALALLAPAVLSAAPNGPLASKAGRDSGREQREVTRQTVDVRTNARKFPGLNVRNTQFGSFTSRTFTGYMPGASLMRKTSPALTVGDIDLRGSVSWSENQSVAIGLYRLPLDTPDLQLIGEGIKAVYGGAQIGERYYAINGLVFGSMYFFDGFVYDTETWEQVSVTTDVPLNTVGQCSAMNPVDGLVYGCFYDEAGENLEFGTVDYTTWSRTSTISTIDMNNSWSAVAFDAAGRMYVLKLDGNLYSGDKNTGECTLIGSTGLHPKYITGGAIDPASGRFFYSCNNDTESALYEIDVTTAAATKLYDFPYSAQVGCLYVPLPDASSSAPAAVTGLKAIFEDGSLSGEISFKAPVTLFDGSAAEGTIDYTLTANGELLESGTTEYGASVNLPVTVANSGSYQFVVTVANENGESPKESVSVYVGDDIPEMSAVTLTYENGYMTVAWDKVTQGVNGGYLVADDVTYTVTAFPSGEVVAENITENTFSQSVEIPESYTVYSYGVSASFKTAHSPVVRSNYIPLGSIIPPYSDDFNSTDDIIGYTILDSNRDNNTWYLDNGRLVYRYSSYNTGDDWFITPAVRLEKGKMYKVNVAASSQGYSERLEIKWGKSAQPSGLTEVLLEPTIITHYDARPYGGYIVPEEDGDYYIGMHAMSDPDMYFLYIESLTIEAGQSTLCPATATDLKAVPDYDGGNSAVVSFTTPDVAIDGSSLASLSSVTLLRGGEEVHKFESPAPGAALSYTDNVDEPGVYTYTVVAANEYGAGLPISTEVRIGMPVPTAPTDIRFAVDGNGVVSLSWSAPAYDSYGNPLNTALITYSVYDCVHQEYVAEGLTETEFSYTAVEEGQMFLYYAVYAVSGSGKAYGLTDLAPVGIPYTMPFAETFADGKLKYATAVVDQVDNGNWMITNDNYFVDIKSVTGDNGMAYMTGAFKSSSASLWTGMISLVDATRPGLGFYVYKFGESNINELKISVQPQGGEWEEIGAFTIEELPLEGWNYVMYDLSAYIGKVITLRINGATRIYSYILIDDITVRNLPAYDLAINKVTAPEAVEPGTEFEVKALVANYGAEAAENYDIVFYLNGKEAARYAGDKILSGGSAEFSLMQTLNPASSTVNEYTVEIDYAADENADNNVSDAVKTMLVLPSYPAPGDLKVEVTGHTATLTWDEPDMDTIPTEPVTETFEEGESGSDVFGEWLFVDVDKSPIGGVSNTTLPGHVMGETLASFWIFDNTDGDFNQSYDAHSGHKYLMSIYRYDSGKVSDWAISPELYGGAQTISFFAKSYNPAYPEKIEVRYSMDGTDIDDFSHVGMETVTLGGDWTEFKVDLPNGARYFAIHSCSTDAFILMVDDVTFCPKNGNKIDMELMGYNVYRDGVKINADPVEENEYTDDDMPNKAAYVVTAVYSVGESAPSNEVVAQVEVGIDRTVAQSAVITVEGRKIVISGNEGDIYGIYTVDGRTVKSGKSASSTIVEVVPGVYVVRAGEKTARVVVR